MLANRLVVLMFAFFVFNGCKKPVSEKDAANSSKEDVERDDIQGLDSYELNILNPTPPSSYEFSFEYDGAQSHQNGVAIWVKDDRNFVAIKTVETDEGLSLIIAKILNGAENTLVEQSDLGTAGIVEGNVEPGRLFIRLQGNKKIYYDFTVVRDIAFSGSFAELATGGASNAKILESSANESDASTAKPLKEDGVLLLNNPNVEECGDLNVTYNGLPAPEDGLRHWITVAKQSSKPAEHTYRYQYLEDLNGTITFSTRGLNSDDKYEVRIFLNWGPAPDMSIYAALPFTVASKSDCQTPMFQERELTASKNTTLKIDLAHASRNSDWVAIATPGKPAPSYLSFKSLPEGVNTLEFPLEDLGPGSYEIKYFEDWEKTREYFAFDMIPLTITE